MLKKLNPFASLALVGMLSLVALAHQEHDRAPLGGRRYQRSPATTNQTSTRLKPRPINHTSNTTSIVNGTSNYTSQRTHVASQQQQQRQSAAGNDRQQAAAVAGRQLKNITDRSQHLDDISHRLDQEVQNVTQEYDTRVPFWNIAHMINSVEQIDLALSAGSNGIETDVSFDSRGMPVEAYHGFPCDCGRHCHHRDEFVKFVRHLARLTVPPASSRLFVVLFDLKLKELKSDEQKETAGRALAEIIHKNLYEPYQMATQAMSRGGGRETLEQKLLTPPPLRVILSINHANDIALAKAFIRYMRDRRLDFMSQQVGFDVGMNDKLEAISAAWDSLNGATFNIWQGDGLTNCANIVRGVERLKEALAIRNGQGHFRKVYYWTADVMYQIRSVLRLGIDAVLTNQPQRVIQVLNEAEFKHRYRLATAWDYPFEQFWVQASASKMKPPTLGETVETIANIQKTSQNFIKTIPDGITAVVKKVHNSLG